MLESHCKGLTLATLTLGEGLRNWDYWAWRRGGSDHGLLCCWDAGYRERGRCTLHRQARRCGSRLWEWVASGKIVWMKEKCSSPIQQLSTKRLPSEEVESWLVRVQGHLIWGHTFCIRWNQWSPMALDKLDVSFCFVIYTAKVLQLGNNSWNRGSVFTRGLPQSCWIMLMIMLIVLRTPEKLKSCVGLNLIGGQSSHTIIKKPVPSVLQ